MRVVVLHDFHGLVPDSVINVSVLGELGLVGDLTISHPQ